MYQVQEYTYPGNNGERSWHRIIESESYSDCSDVARMFSRGNTNPTRVCRIEDNGDLVVVSFFKGGKSQPLSSDEIATS